MATDAPITLVTPNGQGTGGRYRIDGGARLGGLVDASVATDKHGEFVVTMRLGVEDGDVFLVNGLPFVGWATVPEHRRWIDAQTVRRAGTYDYGKLSDSQRHVLTDTLVVLATVVGTPEHQHAYRLGQAIQRVERAIVARDEALAEVAEAEAAYHALSAEAPARV